MKTIMRFQYFLVDKLNLTTSDDLQRERIIGHNENFRLSIKVSKEKLVELLNEYFDTVGGSYNFIDKDSRYHLDFMYKIIQEIVFCTLSKFEESKTFRYSITVFSIGNKK